MRSKIVLLVPAILFCAVSAMAQKTDASDKSVAVPIKTTVATRVDPSLKLFPNPADKYVNIYVEWPSPQSFSISVFDYNAAIWIKEIPVEARKSYQYSLDVTQLPSGKYRILVKGAAKQLEQDLVVVH